MLTDERGFFDKRLHEWLAQYPGKFALIKGIELIGMYDTMADALAEGTRRFGLDSFLVRRVEIADEPIYIPALAHGLLHDDPALAGHGTGIRA